MTSGKIIAFTLFAVIVPQVTSWTIDLPLARKLFFSENKEENAIRVDSSTKAYDNIEPNSFHNAEEYEYYYDKYVNEDRNKDFDGRGYADAYKHQGYMEKKVHDIVRKGSAYLDGLRQSLERYAELLKNCSRQGFNQTTGNQTTWQPGFPGNFSQFSNSSNFLNFSNSSNFPNFSNSSNLSNFSPRDVPQFNFTNTNFSALNPNWSPRTSMAMCAQATKKREHVRRLTDLALWATRRLEDNAYDAKYNKFYEQEQNELLLKLSWFLDRLAYHTGYEPEPNLLNATTTTQRPAASAPSLPLPFADVPREVVQQMMDCLRAESPEPAVERCRYPLPLPEWVQRAYETRDPSFANTRPQDPALRVLSPSPSPGDPLPQSSSLELLIADANSAPKQLSPLTAVRSVRKRSVDDSPLMKVVKYYGKHKVWLYSNPIDEDEVKSSENFDVPNNLPVKSIQKRSLFKKHIHLRIPEPLHALRDHLKKEAGLHYEKNREQVKLIKGHLEKMRHTASLTVKHNLKKFDHVIKKIHKRSVNEREKRSVYYGRKYKPRISENPYKDISYYVKNQEGIEYSYNPVQAALVRAGLEQVFQTGNILVVQRYGSNFNPLDPNPFYSGLLRASVDV